MRVDKKRKALTRFLQKNLDNGEMVVHPVDHPNIQFPPDILVSSREGLVAIFIATLLEIRQQDDLRARFCLNRIALPNITKFILLIDDHAEIHRDFNHHFSEVLSYYDPKSFTEILNICRSPKSVYSKPFPDQLHNSILKRFGKIYKGSSIFNRYTKPYANKEIENIETINEINSENKPIHMTLYNEKVSIQRSRRISISSVNQIYALDSGIPYLSNPKTEVIFSPTFSTYQLDPEKILRVAAISGVSLIKSNTSASMERITQYFDKRF